MLITTVLDTVLSVVGDVQPGTLHPQLQLQRPVVRIRDPSTNSITRTVKSDVPDLISLNGRLPPSSATFSYLFRRGQPFPGDPALSWSINLEHGEIRLVSTSGLNLETGAPATIHVHWFDNDQVEEVKWEWNEEFAELPGSARNVISTLVAFAEGRAEGDGWVGIGGLYGGWEKD